THWNSVGGFVGYRALVNALSRQMPNLDKPTPLSAFNQNPVQLAGGDLTTLLGLVQPPLDANVIKLTTNIPLPRISVSNAMSRFPKKWRPLTDPMVTTCDEAKGKAIVFRDSFAGAWMGFLGRHFHETLY